MAPKVPDSDDSKRRIPDESSIHVKSGTTLGTGKSGSTLQTASRTLAANPSPVPVVRMAKVAPSGKGTASTGR